MAASVWLKIFQIVSSCSNQIYLEISRVIKTLINILDHFSSGSYKKSQLLRSRILGFLAFESVTSWAFFVLIYYLFLKGNWQLGSLVYRLLLLSGAGELLATMFGLLLDLWHLFNIWGSYLISLHINLGFMHTFKTTVDLLLSSSGKLRGTHVQPGNFSKMDHLRESMLVYAKLRILVTAYNNVYGALYVPMIKTCCSMIIVLCVFISVRLAPMSSALVGIFGVSCTFMCAFCLGVFIMFITMVSECSIKFGNYLRNQKVQGPLAIRLVRSYKEEAVKSGEFYKIQKMTCLTVLALLSNFCGSVLISFKI